MSTSQEIDEDILEESEPLQRYNTYCDVYEDDEGNPSHDICSVKDCYGDWCNAKDVDVLEKRISQLIKMMRTPA